MAPRYSEAVDGLHDTLRWLAASGQIVISARADYLSKRAVASMNADEVLDILVDMLSHANPIYWDTRLVDIIDGAAHSLPSDWRLLDPMLFTQNGYIWFGRPLATPPDHGTPTCGLPQPVRAIAWKRREKSLFVDFCTLVIPDMQTRYRIFSAETLGRYTGEILYDRYPEMRKKIDRALNSTRMLTDQSSEAEKQRARRLVQQTANEAYQLIGVNRLGGIPWTLMPWRVGQTLEQTHMSMLDRTPLTSEEMDEMSAKICDVCSRYYFRIFATCLNFLNQRVFVGNQQQTDRSVLQRVAPKPEWKEVNVITLRKAERTKHPSDVEHQPVDWSCHWLVGALDGGFWRNQYMHSTGTHQYRWIMPYMKGDTNKPFKPPSKRVYNVSR